jgi:hypothetical protein
MGTSLRVEANDPPGVVDRQPGESHVGWRSIAQADSSEVGVVLSDELTVHLQECDGVVLHIEDAAGAIDSEQVLTISEYPPVRHDVDDPVAMTPPCTRDFKARPALYPMDGRVRLAARQGAREQGGPRKSAHEPSIASGAVPAAGRWAQSAHGGHEASRPQTPRESFKGSRRRPLLVPDASALVSPFLATGIGVARIETDDVSTTSVPAPRDGPEGDQQVVAMGGRLDGMTQIVGPFAMPEVGARVSVGLSDAQGLLKTLRTSFQP